MPIKKIRRAAKSVRKAITKRVTRRLDLCLILISQISARSVDKRLRGFILLMFAL